MNGSSKRSDRAKSRQSIAHMPSSSRYNGVDKQNATIDLTAARNVLEATSQQSKKKLRGKSLGPGGLEALMETDGNVVKNIPIFQPKSILKPSVPLTPPKTIPTFEELRQRSTRKKSPTKNSTEALLIDFSTPGPSRESPTNKSTSETQNFDPFSPLKIADSAASNHDSSEGREEELLRQEQKRAILEQRAARRKSMANRRVSFAPEATLHTWSVMEMMEDSTTSSAANSTRRQSSLIAQQTPQRSDQSATHESGASDPPSTPPEQAHEPVVQASPMHQRDLHQKKRRRSSAISDDANISGDEVYSSSPSGDITTGSSPIRVEDSINSDSDTDGDTAMSVDELTQTTIHSQGSSSSQSSLEERLRQAASQAGTKGIEYDEFGDDMSMEIANDTVTNAFQPWMQGRQQQNRMDDQENVNVSSPSKKAKVVQAANQGDEDENTQGVTMDMTRAVGGILAHVASQEARRKSAASPRRSSLGRRQSLGANSSYGDESMELTMVAGGILNNSNEDQADDDADDQTADEDMTMEFTTAVGGLQNSDKRESLQPMFGEENETMDMTAAIGGILAPIEEHTEPQNDFENDRTTPMEMTCAVGQIFFNSGSDTEHKFYLHNENDVSNIGSSLQVDSELVASTPKQLTSIASETGSPSLALKPRSSGHTRASRVSQISTTSKSPVRVTPQKSSKLQHETPTKQMTPVPAKAKTPERTPASINVSHRGISPRKLFQAELQARSSPASTKKTSPKHQDLLFAQDELTGRQKPRVVLHAPKPHQHLRRRSSGIGIDKEGFGSPSVTQLLVRRSSIGDAAPHFKLESAQTPRLRFEDPKQIAEEIEAERIEDERRESGRSTMEQEANEPQEENATLQLKDMIESMTPKKSKNTKLNGRKSLAVGSARGLLGKRPMELDDEDDGESTPKRLKAVSREGSPVKKIHLPKPPTKEETTGRLTRIEQILLDVGTTGAHTPSLNQPPSRISTVESPKQTNRYRDAVQHATDERPTSFEDKLDNVVGAIDPSIEHPPVSEVVAEEDKISLQQFLNMTNIHFIELNTTKRRHTLAQSLLKEALTTQDQQTSSMENCFVAAATTMPLLELYQHATRELKSYISAGRKIIRSIEAETLAEQPALFREYVEARPDIKLVMDNQFRNGKSNARLQSKEGWYAWRSQLVDGLQTGLAGIHNDLGKDLEVVENQANILSKIVPDLSKKRDELTHEMTVLHERLEDIESVDYQELKISRQNLCSASIEVQEKLAVLKTLQQQMQEKDDALSQAAELKEEMESQIAEAERVREEYRGWAAKDVSSIRSRVNAAREQSGWSVISAEEDTDELNGFGVALTLTYKGTLRLFFYPAAYEQIPSELRRRSGRNCRSMSGPTAPISLTYAISREDDIPMSELPTEQSFFLQLIQSQLHAFSMMPKGSIAARTILKTVSSGWDLACQVTEEVRLLNLVGVTRVSIQSDEKLVAKLMLVITGQGRLDVEFAVLAITPGDGHFSVTTSVSALPVYGAITKLLDVRKTRKVQNALGKEMESRALGAGAWIGAIHSFDAWHCNQLQAQEEIEVGLKAAAIAQKEAAAVGSTTPKSPVPPQTKTPAPKRSPLATKKSSAVQKKTIPLPTSKPDKFRTSQREQPPTEKTQTVQKEATKDKENFDPFGFSVSLKAPAITPAMQEAMMQRTPMKRVGALRRSPIQ